MNATKAALRAQAGMFFFLIALLVFVVVQSAFDYETTTRNMGTFYNAESAPDRPTYTWSGEIFRACPVELRRWVTDNDGVRHELPTIISSAPAEIGQVSVIRSVPVPRFVSRSGPLTYHVQECSRCGLWQTIVRPVCDQYPPVWVPPPS